MNFLNKLFKKESKAEVKSTPRKLLYGMDLDVWDYLFSWRMTYTHTNGMVYYNTLAFFCHKDDTDIREYVFVYDKERYNLQWETHYDVREYAELWKAGVNTLIIQPVNAYNWNDLILSTKALEYLDKMYKKTIIPGEKTGTYMMVNITDRAPPKNLKYLEALSKQKAAKAEKEEKAKAVETTEEKKPEDNVIKVNFTKKDVDKK